MGHYYSEIYSDEEIEAERKYRREQYKREADVLAKQLQVSDFIVLLLDRLDCLEKQNSKLKDQINYLIRENDFR